MTHLLESVQIPQYTESPANDSPPLGEWTKRQYSTGRIINQLFKKEFISKIRHFPSIIEFISACFVAGLLFPVWYFARKTIAGTETPIFNNGTMMDYAQELIQFVYFTPEPKFVFLPDTVNTQILKAAVEMVFNQLNATQLQYIFVNNTDQMREVIYSSDSNAIGIYWVNAADLLKAYLMPEIQVYKQTLVGDPEGIVLNLFLAILHQLKITKDDWSIIPNQEYAQPTHDDLFDIQIIVAMFAIIPAVLATMPSLQSILLDKDLHVTQLIFMMGCTETQYWFVQSVFMIVSGWVPYLLFAIMMCYMFAMVGTSFTFFLFISTLFVIAHSFFLLFIISFFKHASTGRAMTVITALFVIFFGYLHYFYTLNVNNTSDALKHGLSVVPLSAYQLLILMCFNRVKNGFPPVGWADMFDDSFEYPLWYGVAWLIAGCIFYLLIWLLFNAANSRGFGIQLIRWRDILSFHAWKQMLSKSIRPEDMATVYNAKVALDIKEVSKIFKGRKPIKAVDNVSFTINQREVIVMIGPNGAGKSTLINTISGALLNDSGTMRLFGMSETNHFKDIHQYLGICFQDNVLVPLMNVREHFYLFGSFRGIPETDLENAISFFSDTLQLQECLFTRAVDLSGGQKRKLCLALALLGNPPFVIMDEPTAGVDVQARQLIWKTIAGLKNSTCLITSHALEEAEAVSSRLFIVAKGQIPYRGTSTELRKLFKCGYILRVEREDGKVGPVIDLVQRHIPAAHITEERQDSITMPVDRNVPAMLHELVEKQQELGVLSYSFAVEQLEDMLLNMVESAEAQIEQQY